MYIIITSFQYFPSRWLASEDALRWLHQLDDSNSTSEESIIPAWNLSQIKWQSTSICLVFSWNINLDAMCIDA